MYLGNRFGGSRIEGAEPAQHLHAAERQGEHARVGRDLAFDGPRIEHRNACVGQDLRDAKRQRQADRPSADHGEIEGCGSHGGIIGNHDARLFRDSVHDLDDKA